MNEKTLFEIFYPTGLPTKPVAWKSMVDGKEYPFGEYINHGYGGIKRWKGKEWKDLPADGYPYTIIYK